MAIPTFVGTSAASASGTGAVTPDLPDDATTGDFLLLLIETDGDETATLPSVEWSAVGDGTATSANDGASDRTRITVGWAPYDAGIAREIPDAGNHVLARIFAFRGVDLDDPFDGTDSGSEDENATSHTAATDITTTEDDCLVVLAGSHGDDVQSSLANAANANLSDVSIIGSGQTNQGSDGTIVLIAGGLAAAGAAGTFTWSTGSDSEENAWIAFALKPPAAPEPNDGAATGAIAWAGSAAGATGYQGSATGSIGWAGSATGSVAHEGSSTGAISWVGSASGAVAHEGTSSGSLGWAGSAAGEAPSIAPNEGAATGTIGWAGSASGSAPFGGIASGTITWVGSAIGPEFDESKIIRSQEGEVEVSDQSGVLAAAALAGGLVVSTQSGVLEVTQ